MHPFVDCAEPRFAFHLFLSFRYGLVIPAKAGKAAAPPPRPVVASAAFGEESSDEEGVGDERAGVNLALQREAARIRQKVEVLTASSDGLLSVSDHSNPLHRTSWSK